MINHLHLYLLPTQFLTNTGFLSALLPQTDLSRKKVERMDVGLCSSCMLVTEDKETNRSCLNQV